MKHLLLLAASALYAQAPVPILTTVGPLHCGMRMLDATNVQTWCYIAGPNSTWQLRHNTISSVGATEDQGVELGYNTRASDTVVAGIMWFVWRPSPADPINYQIMSAQCTDADTCADNPPINGTL